MFAPGASEGFVVVLVGRVGRSSSRPRRVGAGGVGVAQLCIRNVAVFVFYWLGGGYPRGGWALRGIVPSLIYYCSFYVGRCRWAA